MQQYLIMKIKEISIRRNKYHLMNTLILNYLQLSIHMITICFILMDTVNKLKVK